MHNTVIQECIFNSLCREKKKNSIPSLYKESTRTQWCWFLFCFLQLSPKLDQSQLYVKIFSTKNLNRFSSDLDIQICSREDFCVVNEIALSQVSPDHFRLGLFWEGWSANLLEGGGGGCTQSTETFKFFPISRGLKLSGIQPLPNHFNWISPWSWMVRWGFSLDQINLSSLC